MVRASSSHFFHSSGTGANSEGTSSLKQERISWTWFVADRKVETLERTFHRPVVSVYRVRSMLIHAGLERIFGARKFICFPVMP